MPYYIPGKDPRDQYLKITQSPDVETTVTVTKVVERTEPIVQPNPPVPQPMMMQPVQPMMMVPGPPVMVPGQPMVMGVAQPG